MKTQTTSVRMMPSLYDEAADAVLHLKKKHKRGWSMSRLMHVALTQFVAELPTLPDRTLDELFESYEGDADDDEPTE